MMINTPIKPKNLKVAENVKHFYNSLLAKAMQVVSWKGFPDTVDIDYLNILLLTEGTACIHEHEGSLYCFKGNLGGKVNINYQPTLYTVANPVVGGRSLKIDTDCVVAYNSSLDKWGNTGGLHQLLLNTAQMLADNTVSLNILQKNSRLSPIISVETDAVKKSVDVLLNKMYKGESYTCVNSQLIDDIKITYLSNSNINNESIAKLIELQQYIIANFYHSIGINSNYNLKRERLISDEIEINNDCLEININNMLKCRRQFCDRLNEVYGLNVSVELSEVLQNNYDRKPVNSKSDEEY